MNRLLLAVQAVVLGLVYSYTPFVILAVYSALQRLDPSYAEASRDLGAGRAQTFLRIILPLSTPAIAITALFSFMTAWNEFILASVFLEAETMYTAPVGLRFFVGGFSSQWGFFAAGSVIVSLPVVILFLYLQKYLVSGLTAGSVK